MKFLYNLGIKIYWYLILIFSTFNKKAQLFVEGRKNLLDQLEKKINSNNTKVLWFHCASLGEFEQARPVIERLHRELPSYRILLTFFSPSGYEVRKNYEVADWIFYLPIDTKQNAAKFLAVVQPAFAFFVKYEFWHHYLSELKNKQIPVISFSAIFRENQLFFKPYGGFYRAILSNFQHIFVQDSQSLELLKGIGLRAVSIGGDTRFDRVKEIVEQKKDFSIVRTFKNNEFTLVVGSSWSPDLEVVAHMINQFANPIKLVFAPHEIGPSYINEIKKAFSKKKLIFYSEATLENVKDQEILVIDNVGMLSSLYQYGEIAYVGGAFDKGLHNILEPATYGIPVFFGKEYSKFKEAVDLVEIEGAFSVKDKFEFAQKFQDFYSNNEIRIEAGRKCKEYIAENIGATDKIISFCTRELQKLENDNG
ncbi:3-deoxy-D-manno-octulosonic acid transferase [Flexithrix dorotheae]|uniref:3-deoxy-D-manno-octulosonic acid transferase n=1 Tax=Flexithrix dorotheae TaxID=70993 RepID=UPI00036D5A72|nr:glycosyltransferase N-terminal domain-containing protein [Flexithrix dorotheae]